MWNRNSLVCDLRAKFVLGTYCNCCACKCWVLYILSIDTVSIVFWNCLVLTEINVGHRQPMPAISGCQHFIMDPSGSQAVQRHVVFPHESLLSGSLIFDMFGTCSYCHCIYNGFCLYSGVRYDMFMRTHMICSYIYSMYGNPSDAPTCGCPFLRISSLWTINDTLAI